MATIRLATAVNIRNFQELSAALGDGNSKYTHLIDPVALEDEFGRLRVWAGNLGALQKGHSSLDYRLRDSPLLSSNALKFLKELETNLSEATAIVTGARLPYEEQAKLEQSAAGDDGDDEDGFFSEDDDESDGNPKTELENRILEVIDIIDNLYKLSIRIRTPTIRSRSLKASSYQPKTPEGVDIFGEYASFDKQYARELIRSLRAPYTDDNLEDDDTLVVRLSKAITLRRRQFRYWRRHRDKLGVSTILEDLTLDVQPAVHRPEVLQRNNTLEAQAGNPVILELKADASEKTRKTLLSGTEATHHHQSLDDIVDARSVTSYATTHRDITGRGVELPSPPKAADGEKDFECPYCFIICPSRYSTGRSWRTHILQDLQPYICTYKDCESPEQLYRSRREWSEHESSHRKAWRCLEHPNAVYRSPTGLQDHLRQQHSDSIAENELDSIVKVGETSTVDLRSKCPICFTDADIEGGLQNHIANHLERFASFALPKDIETTDDGSDGANSIASGGHSVAPGSSQDMPEGLFHSNISSEDQQETTSELENSSLEAPLSRVPTSKDAPQSQLTFDMLKSLPVREDPMSKIMSDLSNESDETDEQELEQMLQTPDSLKEEDIFEETEIFRTYLLSFPGAKSVRFFRRYGYWDGILIFKHETSAIEALSSFDVSRFPKVKIRQVASHRATLKFHVPATDRARPMIEKESSVTDEEESVSSGSITSNDPKDDRLPGLSLLEVPNLSDLYRTRKLLRRDQSYAPNNLYNQVVSFCFYDICQLQADAIVNSANKSMRVTRTFETMNYYVHKRAGPRMKQELKAGGKVKPGQVSLTLGYDLPAKYVIHAARPHYSGASKGMGQFNILSECYRSALRMAVDKGIKTIAFPALGAGGCGFPSRVAARIAIQEVREFLDTTNKGYKFDRITFCVYNGTDEKAYKDLLPVYFPPTHGDLENILPDESVSPIDHLSLAREIEDVEVQTETLAHELSEFGQHVHDFPHSIISELAAINSCLIALHTLFLGSKEIKHLKGQTISDINLLCGALTTACGSVTEMIGESKSTLKPDYEQIWKSYIFHITSVHGMNLNNLLELFRDFAQCLEDYLVRDGIESTDMANMRIRIASYRLKVTGEGDTGSRDHFDEVMYTRQFQREANAPPRTEIIKIHQIPSVSRLYQLGTLEEKTTHSIPSSRLNYTVGLFRGDLTNIEVDVIVNSTDMGFSGMGTLDRTVFRKGGIRMQEDIKGFGICKQGDVRVTPGYSLPAKHVIHVVPPESFRRDSKDVLRKLYREILHMASSLKATSLAIPSIGTGMLSYPVQDVASITMEEVKRYLETVEHTDSLERIILCVYGSNDERVYQSLLPIYFPPVSLNVNKALPAGISPPPASPPTSTDTDTSRPKRTLFGSIGDAFRSVRFGKQPVTQTARPPNLSERHALENFEAHAHDCPTKACENIARTYAEDGELCRAGHSIAAELLQYLYMDQDHSVYAVASEDGQRVRVEVPQQYPMAWNLLITVERSYRDPQRTRPFVSNRPYKTDPQREQHAQSPSEIPPGVTIYNAEVTVPVRQEPEKSIAKVFIRSEVEETWESLQHHEASVHVLPGRISIYETDYNTADQIPIYTIDITPLSEIKKQISTEIFVTPRELRGSHIISHPHIRFQLRSPAQCEMLFQTLKHSRMNHPNYIIPRGEHWTDILNEERDQGTTPTSSAVAYHQDDESAALTIRGGRSGIIVTLSRLSNTDKSWKDVVDSECFAYASNGELRIFEHNSDPAPPTPLLALDLTPVTPITRTSTKRIEIRSDPLERSRANMQGSVHFSLRCKDNADCTALFDAIMRAKKAHPLYRAVYENQQAQEAIYETMEVPADANTAASSTSLPGEVMATEKFDASIGGLSLVNVDDHFSYIDPATISNRQTSNVIPSSDGQIVPSTSEQTAITDATSVTKNVRWTRIDRRLINTQALEEANEWCEYDEEYLLVLRVLSREEILKLAERTRDIRRGKEEMKELARVVGKWEEERREDRGDGKIGGLSEMFAKEKEKEMEMQREKE